MPKAKNSTLILLPLNNGLILENVSLYRRFFGILTQSFYKICLYLVAQFQSYNEAKNKENLKDLEFEINIFSISWRVSGVKSN